MLCIFHLMKRSCRFSFILKQLKHLLRALWLFSFLHATLENFLFVTWISFYCTINYIYIYPNPNLFDRLAVMLNFSPTDCWVFCKALLGTGDVWEFEHLLWGSHQPPDTSLVQFTSSPNLQGFTVQRLKGPLWIWGCHTGASLVDESD